MKYFEVRYRFNEGKEKSYVLVEAKDGEEALSIARKDELVRNKEGVTFYAVEPIEKGRYEKYARSLEDWGDGTVSAPYGRGEDFHIDG